MNTRSNLLRLGAPIFLTTLVLVIALAGTAAGDAQDPDNLADPSDEYQVSEVTIHTVDVLIAESYPVQVFVEISGYLPDPCWNALEPVVEQDGDRFEVEILGEREAGAMCPQVIENYDTTVSLGSPEPGVYLVSVNGVEQEFEVH